MNHIRAAILSFALAFPALLCAQEVRYIDLTLTPQRTELRLPPAPDCNAGLCSAEGGGSIGDGAPDIRDPHALGVSLLRVTPTDINPAEPFEAEFKVLNTGAVPIRVPVSPHLSDLQPGDESVPFTYLSLTLVAQNDPVQGPHISISGFVDLYGSVDHDDTLLLLQPGEWIRVKASVKLQTQPPEPVTVQLHGNFWLRRNTFRPHPGSHFTETQNLYPNATPTPPVEVHILAPTQPDEP